MATDPQIALGKAKSALQALTEWLDEWKGQVRTSNGKSGAVLAAAVVLSAPLHDKELCELYDSFTDFEKATLFQAQVGLLFGWGAAHVSNDFTPRMAEFILAWNRKQLAAANNRCWEHFKARDYREARAMSLYEARMGRDDEGADE
jgi:hypothetical protein